MHLQQIFLFFLLSTNGCFKKNSTENFSYKLGTTNLEIERTQYKGSSDLSIIHVHDNETTAQKAAETILEEFGGTLLTVKNRQERLLKFKLEGNNYVADPNRIFTATGRENTLKKMSRFHQSATNELEGFALFFLDKIRDQKTIIAVHNNTNGAYSVLSYKKGGDFFTDVKSIHINEAQDSDDFFITTSDELYTKLKDKAYNVVLQHNENAADDGSLSIYYGRKNSNYVNVEAEHGNLNQQLQMLKVLKEVMY